MRPHLGKIETRSSPALDDLLRQRGGRAGRSLDAETRVSQWPFGCGTPLARQITPCISYHCGAERTERAMSEHYRAKPYTV